jgi:uncharacterized protein (DUF2141 family)
MLKISYFRHLLLATLMSISCIKTVNAEAKETLTVVINGIQNQKGQICIGVYAKEKGFPMSASGVLQSACAKIAGKTVKQQFFGLKPGNYAVAVVDDQNGDRKLNTDFFGIPKEGFGISKNPTVSVQTGTPEFRDASFALNRNTTINIFMKYSLDP